MSDKPVPQVGGDHYAKTGSKCPHCGGSVEHWDYAAGLPYLDAQVSKYIDRHQEKNGFQDLLKSLTYWEKMARHYYPAEYQQWLQERGLKGIGQIAQMVIYKSPAIPAVNPKPTVGKWEPPGEAQYFADIDADPGSPTEGYTANGEKL